MRHYLGELLEALEKSYPDGLTVNELHEKFSSEIDGTIHDAVRGHLILYPIYDPGGNFGAGDRIYLDVNGFGLLNQMKMKEAIDQLDVSIRRFNESSDKSSKTIELYNARLVNLTLLLVVLTVALLVIPTDTPSSEKYIGILFIVGMVLIMFPLMKNR
jgi:hypothetical protein